jgi:diguanylate cyclase (GGDEF)-like protein
VRGFSEALKANTLFTGLTDSELGIVAAQMRAVDCQKGDVIYSGTDKENAICAVLKGALYTTVPLPNGDEFRQADFPAGSFLGDIDFFEQAPRPVTCKAAEDSQYVFLGRDSFNVLLDSHSETAVKIMSFILRNISKKISAAGSVVSEIVHWGEDARKRAIVDNTTGLFNIRCFDSFFFTSIARSRAEGKPLAFIMLSIDHFIEFNKQYGKMFGKRIVIASSEIFIEVFQKRGIQFRYSDDRFAFLLPNTDVGAALRLCNNTAGKIRNIRFQEYPEAVVSVSIGIAVMPEHAENAGDLKDAADKALNAAKEAGCDRVIIAKKPLKLANNPYKIEIGTIAEKNRIANRIIGEIFARNSFLLLGHKNPDADCCASLVAFAIFLCKFGKDVTIFLPDPAIEQINYLLAICKYNDITVVHDAATDFRGKFSALVILDTPNADMLMKNDSISEMIADPAIRKIELDHHLGADARYTGDRRYCLISQASSTGELIGYLCLKLVARLNAQGIENSSGFFSRNLALAILTGIVGDSQMGRFLKTNRERWYYRIFSRIFERLLAQTTKIGSNNLASMQDIYNLIQSLSSQEKNCFKEMENGLQTSPYIHAIGVGKEKSGELFAHYDNEIIVNVSKYAADKLAEENGKLGMVAYYDDPLLSDFVQFRLRRSASFTGFDLRAILPTLNISNGGGHPGAIGFRIPKDNIPDLDSYMGELLRQIGNLIDATTVI